MKCTKCEEEIDEDEDNIVEAVISSIQRFCHLHCFRCSICADQLSGWYFEKNGELFCRKDYYHRFGERCRHCQSVMSGPVMVVAGVGEVKFHPECFKCTACSSIIGDDESYAYVEQSQLYCNGCFCPNTDTTGTTNLFDKHSGHHHQAADAENGSLVNSKDDDSLRRKAQLPPRPDGLPRCYTIAASSAKESTVDRQSLSSNSISSMKKLNALRPNSATTTTSTSTTTSTTTITVTPECASAGNGNVADITTISNGTTTMTPNSKSIESNRKSRSLEKRQRNRERSSSLSRLLETIRLGSTESSASPSTTCETVNGECSSSQSTSSTSSSSSPFHPANNHHQLTMSHSQSSSYFPTRNGLQQLGSHYRDKVGSNSLSRTKSFRVEPKAYRIFRAADLVKGVLLGRGFFGEVFEVTDKVTQEKMVLKELYHNDREAEANFVREVSILKSLSHKNVLQFIGILYRGKKLNMITEYITGGTLRQLIQDESRPIWWPERLAWARDIASGVNYLHSMSLIHRDLNSQNCLVREDGTVVVADFGLSKITSVNGVSGGEEGQSTTADSSANNENNEQLNANQLAKLNRRRDRRKRYTIVGNPFWMAPEMMHRNKYDERVDIYSFGIILLEIIGSVNADPDVLKRNRDFSVDRKHFLENYVKKSCPEVFWRIAFLCTEMNPDMRPPFHVLERWFQLICSSLHNCQHSQNETASESFLTLVSAASAVDQHNHHHHNHHQQECRSSGHIPVEIINEVANYNSCSGQQQQQLSGSQTTTTTMTTASKSLLSDTVA